MLKINLLTTFPGFFTSPLETSILKRAQNKSLVEIKIINLRDFTSDQHQTTDDRPFGGGPGMVMKIEPIFKALANFELSKNTPGKKIILTSAKGKSFNQALARDYAQLTELTIICGHYEGVDERVAENLVDEEVRVGDYVLTGGEIAALNIIDATTRLIKGVLGNELSNQLESHSQPGYLSFPTYTRPENFQGWSVPEALLTGDHKQITAWRQSSAHSAQS